MLRATCCVICGNPLPTCGRLDRRYCRKSCRAVAYRAGRRESKARPASCLPPPGDFEVGRSLVYTHIPREVLDVLAKHFGQQHESLVAELATARKRLVELEQAAGATAAGAAAMEERRRLEAQAQQLQAELTATRSSLTTQLETAKRQLREAADERTRAERVPTLEGEIQRLTAELAEVRAAVRVSEEEKGKLETAVQRTSAELTDTRSSLLAQLETAKRQQESLERALRLSSESYDALRGQLDEAEAALADYEEEDGDKKGATTDDSAARLASLQTHYGELQRENERLREAVKVQRDSRDDELITVQEQVAALEKEKEARESQIEDMRRLLNRNGQSQQAQETGDGVERLKQSVLVYKAVIARLAKALNSNSRHEMAEAKTAAAAALSALARSNEPEAVEVVTETACRLVKPASGDGSSSTQTALVRLPHASTTASMGKTSDSGVSELRAKYTTACNDRDEARANLKAAEQTIQTLTSQRDDAIRAVRLLKKQTSTRESELGGKARQIVEKIERWAAVQNPLTVEAHYYVGPYDPRKDKLIQVLLREIVDHAKLARAQWIKSKPMTAHLLNLDLTALQQAQALAMAERWRMYADPPERFEGKVTWEKFGYILNPQAELFLCESSDKRGYDAWWQRMWYEPIAPVPNRRR